MQGHFLTTQVEKKGSAFYKLGPKVYTTYILFYCKLISTVMCFLNCLYTQFYKGIT